MVNHHILTVEKELCYGCHTCEVACKQEHTIPAGVWMVKLVQRGPENIGGKLRTEYKPLMCMHCEKPPCVESCPVKAIYKRRDGVVLIDENKCDGCRRCLETCPLGAIQFYESKGVAVKCDLCVTRLDAGLKPACVHHCPTEAIKLVATRRVPLMALNGVMKSNRLPTLVGGKLS